MNTKLIVTNFQALLEKYGSLAACQIIRDSLTRLIELDRARQIESILIALDDIATLGPDAMTNRADRQQAKRAIDAAFRRRQWDYLTIIGSDDIVPHQLLRNPNDDGDPNVPSDLPYACESGYQEDVAYFLGPTRVVGRIPDIPGKNCYAGATDFARTIDGQANWKRGTEAEYADYFAVTIPELQKQVRKSVRRIFCGDPQVNFSPDIRPDWSRTLLARRIHLIVCHGTAGFPTFFDGVTPVLESRNLVGRLTSGTVAVAECCYGAQLYDPAAVGRNVGMWNVYFGGGAYAYVGSTTKSFLPDLMNEGASSLCEYFLRRIRAGASLGRAFLEARHRFATSRNVLYPVDQKTLAQFILLGDPSIHPLQADDQIEESRLLGAVDVDDATYDEERRKTRRMVLRYGGELIRRAIFYAVLASLDPIPRSVSAVLDRLATEAGMRAKRVRPFRIMTAPPTEGTNGNVPNPPYDAVYELFDDPNSPKRSATVYVASVRHGEVVNLHKYICTEGREGQQAPT